MSNYNDLPIGVSPAQLEKMQARIAALEAENARLAGIVEKLPATADGVPITFARGEEVYRYRKYCREPEWFPTLLLAAIFLRADEGCLDFSGWYSTPAAALAAKGDANA